MQNYGIIRTENLINTPATLQTFGSVTSHRRADMDILTQKRIPFTGRKKKPQQKTPGLTPRREARLEVVRLLGGVCVKCGFDDTRALQIDHVNGGGGQERRKVSNQKMYTLILEEVKQGSSKYQILCANCNWIKRHEKGEHGDYAKLVN